MKRNVPIAILFAAATVALIIALRPDPAPDPEPPPARPPVPPAPDRVEAATPQPSTPVKNAPPEQATAPRATPKILEDLARALREEDLESARRHLAELRAIAVPPPVPDARNAAILYEEAFELLKDIPNDEAAEKVFERALRGESLSDAELQLLRDWRSARAGVLDLLLEAAGMPECRFPLDYDRGLAMKFPHLESMGPAARLLRHEALRLELEGRGPDASQTAWAGLALGSAMRGESIVVAHLIANVADGVTVDSLRGTLDPSAPELGEYLDALEPQQMRQTLARGLAGDMYGLLVSFINQDPEVLGSDYTPDQFRWSDLAYYVETMADAIELAGHPFAVAGGELELLEKERMAAAPGIAREILPAVWRMGRIYARSESRLSILKIAMQLERHRDEHGRYPDALGAEMPLDPFTGVPFVYTRQEGGFMLENGAEAPADHLVWFSTRGW